MDGVPWPQFTAAAGGWILAGGTIWLVVGSFVMGRLFSRRQHEDIVIPLKETIAHQREEITTLGDQKDVLQREILANQTQFFLEITEARSRSEDRAIRQEGRNIRQEERDVARDERRPE